MHRNPFLKYHEMEILAKARRTFGDTTQILVAMEELCELACVCAKYPRYEDSFNAKEELHNKAIDELADVTVVINHIINIMDIDPYEVEKRISGKVARVERWVNKSSSMQITTEDRKVEDAEE